MLYLYMYMALHHSMFLRWLMLRLEECTQLTHPRAPRSLRGCCWLAILSIGPKVGFITRTTSYLTPPPQVVARLLRPGRTPPGTAWETFMLSLSDGDLKGMW